MAHVLSLLSNVATVLWLGKGHRNTSVLVVCTLGSCLKGWAICVMHGAFYGQNNLGNINYISKEMHSIRCFEFRLLLAPKILYNIRWKSLKVNNYRYNKQKLPNALTISHVWMKTKIRELNGKLVKSKMDLNRAKAVKIAAVKLKHEESATFK